MKGPNVIIFQRQNNNK